MTEKLGKHSRGFREKLLLTKRLFKGDKVVWILFLLLSMVEVSSSPVILNHVGDNFLFAVLEGTMILTLCIAMTILVVNIHYRYFKAIVPLMVMAGFLSFEKITIKSLSPIALIEATLYVSMLIRISIVSRGCRGLYPLALAMGFALLMAMQAIFYVEIFGSSVILNSLFVGIILSVSRVMLKQE